LSFTNQLSLLTAEGKQEEKGMSYQCQELQYNRTKKEQENQRIITCIEGIIANQ
jgi:hypothetical protein